MDEKRTTARAFHDADGVDDWRILFSGAHAYFRVRSFEHGARFVAAIAEVAEAVGHFPDVDLRPEGVTVRTASGEYGALSQRDVELARRISVEARRLQVEPDPTQVQAIGIAVAQDAGSDVGPFWAAVLGYRNLGAGEDVVDRHRRHPHVSFQRLHPPKPGRGRTHIDVSVPADQAEARVAAALAAGGRLADGPTRPTGGRSRRPRTTASTSRRGRTSKTTTANTVNAPAAISITPVLVADLHVEGERMPVYVHLIDHPDARVLVDTGMTEMHPLLADMDPRLYPLSEQDFDLASVDMVVNTHLHGDHCGGNHLFAGKPIYVQRRELDDARREDGYTIREWLDAPGVTYVPVDGELELLPGVRLLPAPGHTPGTQVVVVETGGRPVVIGGDVAVWFGEFDEPPTEGRTRVLALDPEMVWLAHEHEPWRPPTV